MKHRHDPHRPDHRDPGEVTARRPGTLHGVPGLRRARGQLQGWSQLPQHEPLPASQIALAWPQFVQGPQESAMRTFPLRDFKISSIPQISWVQWDPTRERGRSHADPGGPGPDARRAPPLQRRRTPPREAGRPPPVPPHPHRARHPREPGAELMYWITFWIYQVIPE